MDKLISLCMIVRDEEKVLARALDGVKDCVDEIVIVDTGSRCDTILWTLIEERHQRKKISV